MGVEARAEAQAGTATTMFRESPMKIHGIVLATLSAAVLGAGGAPQTDKLGTDGGSPAAQQSTVSPPEVLTARAKSLELNTPYVPPPGDPLEHHTSGFAKIMCSAVFVTGLDPDFAA